MRDAALEVIQPKMEFTEAAKAFLAICVMAGAPGAPVGRYVRPKTVKFYERSCASCALFFGGMLLEDIRWHHMRAYQQARISGAPPFVRYRRPQDAKPRRVGGIVIPAKGKSPCPAKPQQVNQEMQLVRRMKVLAGCWTQEDNQYFRHLQKEGSDVQRALTPEEQSHWLEVASSRERWSLVLWYSVLAFDTATSTNELRGLRLGDVSVQARLITIPWSSAKNKYRKRTIAVENADALWALEKLVERAQELGARDPQHYLFPIRDRERRCYDPQRPMTESGIKRLWQEVRDASGLVWFRPYDTRHTAATRMAENGMPIDVIMSRMGHVTEEMREHYIHISQAAQRRWLRDVESGFGPGSVRAGYASVFTHKVRRG